MSLWDGTHDGAHHSTHDDIVSEPEWESFEKVGVILQLFSYGIISIQVHQLSCFVLRLAIVAPPSCFVDIARMSIILVRITKQFGLPRCPRERRCRTRCYTLYHLPAIEATLAVGRMAEDGGAVDVVAIVRVWVVVLELVVGVLIGDEDV